MERINMKTIVKIIILFYNRRIECVCVCNTIYSIFLEFKKINVNLIFSIFFRINSSVILKIFKFIIRNDQTFIFLPVSCRVPPPSCLARKDISLEPEVCRYNRSEILRSTHPKEPRYNKQSARGKTDIVSRISNSIR